MIDVLVAMCLCEYYAHDLHYGAYGDSFYALHLLADKLDFGSAADDLKESWFLGEKKGIVPSDYTVHDLANKKYKNVGDGKNLSLLTNLQSACDLLVAQIEEFKRNDNPPSGVAAILDGVSTNALVVSGLCGRTIIAGIPS